jgi:hypothetical protein
VGALVVSSAIVGCAGDATVGPDPGTPVVEANGGVPQGAGTSNETRAAGPEPQQVQVTVGGNPQTGFLPGGLSLTAGEMVGTIDPGVIILQGLSTIGGNNGAAGGVNVQSRTHQAGDIMVRRQGSSQQHHSGVRLLNNGTLSGRLVLPDGDYEIFIKGPLVVARGGQRLDVQTLIFHGEVRDGFASVPQTIQGELPINGGSSHPLRLDIQMPNRFNNGFVELKVIHGNGILHQDKTLSNGFAQFHDLVFSGNSVIPQVGVQTVEFRYSSSPID